MEAVKLLVAVEGVDVNAKDSTDTSALSMVTWLLAAAAKEGYPKVAKAQVAAWRSTAHELIAAGARPDSTISVTEELSAALVGRSKPAKKAPRTPKPNEPCTCGKHSPPRKYKKCCGAPSQ